MLALLLCSSVDWPLGWGVQELVVAGSVDCFLPPQNSQVGSGKVSHSFRKSLRFQEHRKVVAELENVGYHGFKPSTWHCYKSCRGRFGTLESSIMQEGSLLTASPSASDKDNDTASVIQCGWGSPVAESEGVGLCIQYNTYGTLNVAPSNTRE